ncbi:tRNA ligase [Paenibacillus chitinolyticus]|uniref:tRNA ligase n=2 Tax=Paenibacillus chitinolyticus TaxID=79263 RepID=A0ABT4FER2_9BACL|nr:tRNA ligase [Paenibacillus chitinolyticus]MCY9591253.1 tRNA ligase [Paenibacillus chitinolyticus]MCY9595564.1 tRNA ligase [Paenibacillus chitinolyticus]
MEKAGDRMFIRVPLDKVAKAGDLIQLMEKIYYLSDRITNVSRDEAALTIEYGGSDEEEVVRRLDALCASMAGRRKLPYRKVKDNRRDGKAGGRAQAQTGALSSRERDSERSEGSGVSERSEHSESAKEAHVLLEQALVKLLRGRAHAYGAALRRYPAMMPESVLQKSGYIRNFPQNVYAVGEFRHQFDTMQEIRTRLEDNAPLHELLQPSGMYLQPCVCYHVYEERSATRSGSPAGNGSGPGSAGAVSSGPKLALYSAYGPCFRHEHASRIDDSRLREFGMFEIVYIGGAQEVRDMRQKLLEDTWRLFGQLGLEGYVETASDPFFLPEDTDRRLFQLAAESKFELRFAPGGESASDYAVTSFNVCGDVLCKAFGITGEPAEYGDSGEAGEAGKGVPLHSGCTAFGVDRWVQALAETHGYEAGSWPQLIREHL